MKKNWVLIIDDDADFRQAVSDTLGQAGFRAVQAGKLSEAVAKLTNQKFRCVLLDLKLEKHDGERLLMDLRKDSRNLNHDTPVVIVSGYLEPSLVKRAGKVVQGILVKPVDARTLIDKVSSLIPADERTPESGSSAPKK